MELYFLKSAACLAVFLLFYKLLLEKESMHGFNRFYLLFSVVISFLVPFITLTSYVDAPTEALVYTTEKSTALTTSLSQESGIPVWPLVLWALYFGGVAVFGIKFISNLRELFLKIKNNPRLKERSYTHVLLKEEVVPHTFLDYIFLNKRKFEEDSIPREVFEHEQAHADQKHSYDILFMELLQVVLWFHPLLYLTKNAIKLNHEFLADKMVLKKGTATAEYQQMLLAFSSGASPGSLAHPINYSFIKKRFTVMKTKTPTWAIWARSLLVLPLAALLLYGFSTKEMVMKEMPTQTLDSSVLELVVDPEGHLIKGDQKVSMSELRKIVEAGSYAKYEIQISEGAPREIEPELVRLMAAFRLPGTVATCTTSKNQNPAQESATPEMVKEYNRLVKDFNSRSEKRLPIKVEDVIKMKGIHDRMTDEQKENSESFPETRYVEIMESIPPPPPPAPPTPPGTLDPDTPVPPPPPPAPLEHIKELAEKGAKFFIAGKGEVSAKEAIKLVEDSKNISINVKEKDSVTTVYISRTKR